MIDFACKQFNLNDIIKCGLGLTKSDYKVMEYFLSHKLECKTFTIAENLNLNLTTVQKAVKKLNEKEIIFRHQKNIEGGGYLYVYKCAPKEKIRAIVKKLIKNWTHKVELEIDYW